MAQVMAFCIAGHHGGIPNQGTPANTEEEGTLLGRLKRRNLPDYRAYQAIMTTDGLGLLHNLLRPDYPALWQNQ